MLWRHELWCSNQSIDDTTSESNGRKKHYPDIVQIPPFATKSHHNQIILKGGVA